MKKFLKKFPINKTLAIGAGVSLVGFSALAQTANTSGQIGPGSAGTISPAQGVTPAASDKPHQILDGALTPQTRQTLWEAMQSVSPDSTNGPGAGADTAHAAGTVMIGPGEGAEINGTSIDKVPFENLPASVKDALNGDIHGALKSGSDH